MYIRHIYRYRAVQLRQRFEEHRNEKDMAKAASLLAAGQEELFKMQHYQPIYGNRMIENILFI